MTASGPGASGYLFGDVGLGAQIDLKALALRENEQVEWKENVVDVDDVVETLSAFANDLANLGGGYVVCGAREAKDPHGFPTIATPGLTADRFREIEGVVLTRCRERISPGVTPLVAEAKGDTPGGRVLIFIIPSTGHAHLFRRRDEAGKYFVRVGRETREARDGILKELLVRKGAMEPWDRRPCQGATVNDFDLLTLRDALQRMGLFNAERGVEQHLSDNVQINPFVPSLCAREPLTNTLRPRNFAMLLFGRNVQRFIPGAISVFSAYPGKDRSEPHAERVELEATLVDQARRLIDLLNTQSSIQFDKTEPAAPNALKYPRRALHEAAINAIAHRDYELTDPTRVTVFVDRVEVTSPGPLPVGIEPAAFKEGRSGPKWRNQALAWILSRLQLAQAEGQGIPTILRSMKEEGCPPPIFDLNEGRVVCTLPAHPRHALVREYRAIEEAISVGDFIRAQEQAQALLTQDSLNTRAVQLLAEASRAQDNPAPIRSYLEQFRQHFEPIPPQTLVQLADVLSASASRSESDLKTARSLYRLAAKQRLEEREARRVAMGLDRAGEPREALAFIDSQMREHPEWTKNPAIFQIRGNALIGMAKLCSRTARNRNIPRQTRRRAWDDFRRFLDQAERELTRAMSLEPDHVISEIITRNLEFLRRLRGQSQPPRNR